MVADDDDEEMVVVVVGKEEEEGCARTRVAGQMNVSKQKQQTVWLGEGVRSRKTGAVQAGRWGDRTKRDSPVLYYHKAKPNSLE